MNNEAELTAQRDALADRLERAIYEHANDPRWRDLQRLRLWAEKIVRDGETLEEAEVRIKGQEEVVELVLDYCDDRSDVIDNPEPGGRPLPNLWMDLAMEIRERLSGLV